MKKTFSVLLCFILLFCTASAHAGRTDANGGHWDRSTGEYHYHHGYPAHQHTNGICPYDYNDLTGSNSGSSSSISTVASVSYENEPGDYGPEAETDFETKRDAFYSGFEWGVEYSHDDDIAGSAYNDGYDEGYKQGYSDGNEDGYEEGINKVSDENYNDGFDDGYNQGSSETYESAKQEGYEQGVDETESFFVFYVIFATCLAVLICALYFRLSKKHDALRQSAQSLEAKYKKAYSAHLEYVQNTNIERNYLKAAIAERDAKLHSLQTPQLCLPNTSEKVKPCSFGKWPLSVHLTDKQFQRYQRSKADNLAIMAKSDDGFIIQGTSDIYITTLDSCTCPDFIKNIHSQAPCKHIYFLARMQGFDVDSIFEDYNDNSD